MAAGGGCIDHIRNGWNLGVCVSAPNRVYGDIYVNTRGSLGTQCYIDIEITQYDRYNNFEGIVRKRTDGCYAGHHPAISAPKYSGKTYRTFSRVMVNGALKNYGNSPWAW
jgi:hypothetical protein